MNQTPDEELRSRLDSLEKEISTNRQRIKTSRALNALLVFLLPIFFFTGDFRLGEKFEGNIKTRDLDASDLLATLGLGATALGVISIDELLELGKKLKK